MRSAHDDWYAARAAFVGQGVAAFDCRRDRRDANDVGPAIFSDPGRQIETLREKVRSYVPYARPAEPERAPKGIVQLGKKSKNGQIVPAQATTADAE